MKIELKYYRALIIWIIPTLIISTILFIIDPPSPTLLIGFIILIASVILTYYLAINTVLKDKS